MKQTHSSVQKLLEALIALPSVNPAFCTDTHLAGEERVAAFLEAGARKCGLHVSRQKVWEGRDNLVVTLRPSGRIRSRVLLAPHMDTVGVQSSDQLEPRVSQGRLHGRGACDTKGSVAAMFQALLTLARTGPIPQETEIVFVGLIDEENGQSGSRAFTASSKPFDLAIVGEPTRLQAITSHKGDLWIEVSCVGQAAHGATPHLGVNAVEELAEIICLLRKKYAPLLRRRKHPLLGSPTYNVGTIRGGLQANIVPDQSSILIDRRTIPGENDRRVLEEIRKLLSAGGLKAKVSSSKGKPCPPLETKTSIPAVAHFLGLIGQKKPAGANYFCDAAVIASGGTPSLVFGPGDIAQAHTVDEWVSLSDLEGATQILTHFLRSLP